MNRREFLKLTAAAKKLDAPVATALADDITRMAKNVSEIVHGLASVASHKQNRLEKACLKRIVAAFGDEAVWAFRPTREGNTILLALRTPQNPVRGQLAARAETIQTRWGLPARKWLRVFKPVAPAE